MKNNRKIRASACLAAVLLLLAACKPTEALPGEQRPPIDPPGVEESGTLPDDAEKYFEDTSEMDLGFSKGDLDSDYDGNAQVIDLSAAEKEISITTGGTYILRGSAVGFGITVETADTEKVRIVLDGVSIINENAPAIYIKEADKVFVILAEKSENFLSDGENREDETADGVIFSRADLTVNGSGALVVNGAFKHGIVSKDDLVITGGKISVTSISVALSGKDCVKIGGGELTLKAGSDGIRSDNTEDETRGFVYINGGRLDIISGNDGIQAQTLLKIESGEISLISGGGSANSPAQSGGSWGGFPIWGANTSTDAESMKGLKSYADIIISGGSINADSEDDGIHSNRSISILGGTITVASGDDGIHADEALVIYDGNIKISKSYEGLEAKDISIRGGDISLISSDDGLNAAGGNDGSGMMGRPGSGFGGASGSITISGGNISVDASGDGIDSNGTITVTGGVTLVSGPTNGGNGAFDYDGSAHVSGGVLVALGSTGMAQSFTSAEGQGAMLCSFNTQKGGLLFEVRDEEENVIVSFTPNKNYQCAVVTAPDIQKGGTYTLLSGGEVIATVEMIEELYGGSGGMGGGMRPGGGGPGGRPR